MIQPGRYRPSSLHRAVPLADGGISQAQYTPAAAPQYASNSRMSTLDASAGLPPQYASNAVSAGTLTAGPTPYGNQVTANDPTASGDIQSQLGLGAPPSSSTSTPGGPTTSPVQGADETFNSNLRDTSTDLGDISGTNSRRSMEFLQQGQQLEDQAGQQAAGYASDYAGARNAGQQAANQLEQTPGYTPGEASQINVDYGKYQTGASDLNNRYLTPQEQTAIQGNPNQASTEANLMSGAIGNTLQAGAAAGNTAIDQEGQLEGTALTGEQAALGKAVDPSQLGLSSNFTSNYEMTPEQQQDIVTAAGTTVGNQYRSAQSDLERQAAGSGNVSPVALAAAKQNLLNSESAQAGDAMTQARIDASNAAANRLQTEEGMRVGTAQDIASREQQNASTVGGQALQAIESTGQQRQSEADIQRQAALQGNEAGGEAAINAAEYGDTNASNRAAGLATNRQQTTADIQNTQYQQGVQTGQLTSQGAQTTGNARRQGQQEYLGYQQGEQQMGETGQEQNQSQQIGAYGAKTGAANQAENIATTATADTRGQGVGDKASSGLGSMIGGLEDGGVVGSDLSSDDPMAQPNDPSAYGDPSSADGGTYAPKPSMATRVRTGITNQIEGMGRYGRGGGGSSSSATAPDDYTGVGASRGGSNPLQSYVRDEIAQGVGAAGGAVASLFEKGGYVSKPTLAVLGERGPEMVVPLHRTPSTKLPAATLGTAARQIGQIGRYGGPHGPIRPMTPMRGSLAAR